MPIQDMLEPKQRWYILTQLAYNICRFSTKLCNDWGSSPRIGIHSEPMASQLNMNYCKSEDFSWLLLWVKNFNLSRMFFSDKLT